jgi:predicted nucleotidyltransferase
MEIEHVRRVLQAHRQEIALLGVRSLAVFGSVARGEAQERSDVDMLVEFSLPVGIFQFVRVKAYLESILGCPVDLVVEDAIRPQMRDRILREAVHAA